MKSLYRIAALFLTLSLSTSAASLASPRDSVNDSLRRASRDLDSVVKNVQQFLTMSGRWLPMPKGNDMMLCQGLQTFQQQLNRAAKNNNSGSYNSIQAELQQLQMQTQQVDSLISQAGMGGNVPGSWMQVKSDIAAATNALYYGGSPVDWNAWYDGRNSGGFTPGGNVTPFNPGGNPYNPGYNPSPFAPTPYTPVSPFGPSPYVPQQDTSGQITDAARRAERDLEKMVQKTTQFLQMRGKWPPPGGAEMQLCQQLQQFQQQLRKFHNDASGRTSYALLQGDVQALAYASAAIESQLAQIGATPDVMSTWFAVKGDLSAMNQSFYYYGNNPYFGR